VTVPSHLKPLKDVWRCPVHGLVEPLQISPNYGTGDPDEWGTCPLDLLEEGEVCGERMQPVDIYEEIPEQVGGGRGGE
jgi:hypothetical protein